MTITVVDIEQPVARSRVRVVIADPDQHLVRTSLAVLKHIQLEVGSTYRSYAALKDELLAAEYEVGMERAYEVLGYRDRSVHELRTSLAKDGYASASIDRITDRLTDLGYLDDAAYAVRYVRSALSAKKGLRKIAYDLNVRGISADYIEVAIASHEDGLAREIEHENARSLAQRWLRPGAGRSDREKVLRRLVGKGYSFEVAKEAVGWAFLDESS